MGSIVDSEDGYQNLQQDLDWLYRWAEEWLMEFHTDKCEVLYFGKSEYRGWDVTLQLYKTLEQYVQF